MQLEMQRTANGVPVQYEGTVEGRPFYFRARNDRWFFAIADTLDEAVEAPSALGVADFVAKRDLGMDEFFKLADLVDLASSSDPLLPGPFVREALWGETSWAASFMPFEEAERIIQACAEEYVAATTPEG